MASFIPITPCLPVADDLHSVEHEDGHISKTFAHRKVPGCKKIKKHQFRRRQDIKEKWFNEKVVETNNVSY